MIPKGGGYLEQPFSYDEYCQQELDSFFSFARESTPTLPVYSGDVAAAFRLRHRFVKDCIEVCYRQLRTSYGKKVHHVNYKRGGGARAMNGYILPMVAMMQVFSCTGVMALRHEMLLAEFTHLCFCPDTSFLIHLN